VADRQSLAAMLIVETRRLSAKAIIVGCLTSKAAAILVGAVVGTILVLASAIFGALNVELDAALEMRQIRLTSEAIGLFCIFLGGAVAAGLARGSETANAAAVGAVSLILGMTTAAFRSSDGVTAVVFLLKIPTAACGGMCVARWRRWRQRKC
jgi:hypothetical protein